MEDSDIAKLVLGITLFVVYIIAAIVKASAQKSKQQQKPTANIPDENFIPTSVRSTTKARKKNESPKLVVNNDEPKEKREFSEKEKMIIYSEIMKPKFDE